MWPFCVRVGFTVAASVAVDADGPRLEGNSILRSNRRTCWLVGHYSNIYIYRYMSNIIEYNRIQNIDVVLKIDVRVFVPVSTHYPDPTNPKPHN